MARIRGDAEQAMMLRKLLDQGYGDPEEGRVANPMPPMDRGSYDAQVNGATIGNDSESEDDEYIAPRSPAPPSMNQAGGQEMVPVPKPIVDAAMAMYMNAASANSISKSRGADGNGAQPAYDAYDDMMYGNGFDQHTPTSRAIRDKLLDDEGARQLERGQSTAPRERFETPEEDEEEERRRPRRV